MFTENADTKTTTTKSLPATKERKSTSNEHAVVRPSLPTIALEDIMSARKTLKRVA